MSALRLPGPDGRTILVPIDDGAVGRITHSIGAIRGGFGNPVISGSHVVGESDAEKHRRGNRAYKIRQSVDKSLAPVFVDLDDEGVQANHRRGQS